MQQISLDELVNRARESGPRIHYRVAVTLIKCVTLLAVVTYGETSILDALVAWIGRL